MHLAHWLHHEARDTCQSAADTAASPRRARLFDSYVGMRPEEQPPYIRTIGKPQRTLSFTPVTTAAAASLALLPRCPLVEHPLDEGRQRGSARTR